MLGDVSPAMVGGLATQEPIHVIAIDYRAIHGVLLQFPQRFVWSSMGILNLSKSNILRRQMSWDTGATEPELTSLYGEMDV
jgi:hypothetical protein